GGKPPHMGRTARGAARAIDGKEELTMEMRSKLRGLVESLSPEQVTILAEEISALRGGGAPQQTAPPAGIAIEEITVAGMQDPALAARVRDEVNAALRGER